MNLYASVVGVVVDSVVTVVVVVVVLGLVLFVVVEMVGKGTMLSILAPLLQGSFEPLGV